METQLETQLQSSIVYRRLIDEIETAANRYAKGFDTDIHFTPEAKAEMTRLVGEAVGKAVKSFTLRCPACDSDRVYLQCIACKQATKIGEWGER